jgi:polyphosphate:AMP phosphotransferase
MFESAEIGHAIDDATYDAEQATLREALLEVQYDLREQANLAVIILINGVEGAGKGETVRLLNEWMDPRLIQVSTFDQPTDEELARPALWRYWRQLPAKGRIGIFFGNWYSQILQGRVHGALKRAQLDQAVAVVLGLEQMLSSEGVVIFKFWFHLSKRRMQARLEALSGDPMHSWKLSPLDWQQSKTYDKFVRVGEDVLRSTSRDYAPWFIVEGADANYRSLTVGRILLEGLQTALQERSRKTALAHATPLATRMDRLSLLDCLDMRQRLRKEEYREQLSREQGRLAQLMREKAMRRCSLVAVFEGNDAAGKGGAIRRVAAALDPRQYRIVAVSAPSEEERAQPYLWRFWRHIPALGKFTVFDRSWYGRVLVERVEGLCAPADWLRAYAEINDFEEQLTSAGVVLVKFWLAIDQDTQLLRFREREANPVKRFKITEDDWRNRAKWPHYCEAVADMVDRTSTRLAPWTLVEANDKPFARVKVLRTLNDTLEAALARAGK